MMINIMRYFPTILVFFLLFSIFYFYNSDLNRKNNESRANIIFNNLLKNKAASLTIVENDTNDILDFKSDVDNYLKKKKKRYFWNLLK